MNGFSPYENHLLSGLETHVMLFAFVGDGMLVEAQAALKRLDGRVLKQNGIINFSTYTKELDGRSACMVYFDYAGETYLEAVNDFESAEPVDAIKAFFKPHPRAVQDDQIWLQMEWINYIYGAKPTDADPVRIAQVTRIKPEREEVYRTLHQTVWPGVCDHMARAGNHNFSIFMVELGDELYQFFYVESYATPEQNEKMKTYRDPTYQRWYDVAAPCLDPLPGAVDCWTKMDQVSE